MIEIIDARREHLPTLLAMNNASAPAIVGLSESELEHLFSIAAYFRVAIINGKVSGFIIGLRPDADYASPNFRWFCSHFEEFIYIDRVVVNQDMRGHGIGKVFYADVHSFAEQHAPYLTCEVAIEPRNDVSLLFHGSLGFHEVGQHSLKQGQIVVSMLAKELPSFEYVRDQHAHRSQLGQAEH